MRKPVLEICDLNKSFYSVPVLKNINFSLQPGEVCGFLGENGAGKSVLMKILIGMLPSDSGTIKIDGVEVDTYKEHPQTFGIHATLQGRNLIENMSVGDNLFLSRELMYRYLPIINQYAIEKHSRMLLAPLCDGINGFQLVNTLSLSQRKLVEICKAFAFNPKVVILDEPTAPLEYPDVERLFAFIRKVCRQGVSVILISHNLEEIMQVADRIVVMTHGAIVGNELVKNIHSTVRILESMAGRDLRNRYPKLQADKGEVVFEANSVGNAANSVRNVSFSVRKGEIVGIAGLEGAGKSSVARMIFGLEDVKSGKFTLDGKPYQANTPRQAMRKGVAYISNDVQSNIFFNLNIAENINFLMYKKYQRGPIIIFPKLYYSARQVASLFRLKLNRKTNPRDLSMGTLQRLALSRWCLADSKLFIMHDPSLQLDIPSKLELYNIMSTTVVKGNAILLISSDIDELIGMCDRLFVMRGGEIVEEMDAQNASTHRILEHFYGLQNDSP